MQSYIFTAHEITKAPNLFGYRVLRSAGAQRWCVMSTSTYNAYRADHAVAPWDITVGIELATDDLSELNDWLVERELARLSKEVRSIAYNSCLGMAKQLPYTRECTCQRSPTHIANDCHVHNDNPRHFIGEFEFDCTCPES